MNFLAPLFLVGALAVSLPLLFHLIRRSTRTRTLFSSLMFLKPTPPRLTRRSRFEHILLLLLRCVAICLLATGFARPFVKHVLPESQPSVPPKRVVILVDSSASMRRENLWTEARDKVATVLRKMGASDSVAILSFDRQMKPLVTFDEWNAVAVLDRSALAASRLAQVKPGWEATRLDQAIVRAAELLSDSDTNGVSGPRQIIVVSDFQSGSKLSGLQGQEWPGGIEVVGERVAARTSNAGLQLLARASDASPSPSTVRLRVSNAADSRRDVFQVGWVRSTGESAGKATEVYVPAGESRIVTLSPPEDVVMADRIVLQGDEEDFDNAVFNVKPRAVRVPVLYLGNEAATNSRAALYFIQRAFQASPQQQVEIVAKSPSSVIPPGEIDAAAMFIASDAISESVAGQLRGKLQQGKTLVFAPASADAAGTLGFLLGGDRIQAEETAPRNYAMLGDIDFRHPLLAAFADARYSDFTKIHFWKYRRMDVSGIPDARVVAKFDSDDPAIVEIPVGQGRVILFTSGWSPEDSQLALSTKFVPLLYSILEWSGSLPSQVAQFQVGDIVPMDGVGVQAGNALSVTLPDGSLLNLAASETNFTETTMPGIYRLKSGTSEREFAVNLDAAESRTAPLPADELERLGVPGPKGIVNPERAAEERRLVKNAELENRQKLWRWFIIVTLAVLLLETAVAGSTARKQSIQSEATA